MATTQYVTLKGASRLSSHLRGGVRWTDSEQTVTVTAAQAAAIQADKLIVSMVVDPNASAPAAPTPSAPAPSIKELQATTAAQASRIAALEQTVQDLLFPKAKAEKK